MKKYEIEIFINQRLPHNFLAERAILTCLIANSRIIENVTKVLPIEAFYFSNHQEIYKAIEFMYEGDLHIDFLTLTEFLQKKRLLKKIGGIQVMIELVNQPPNQIYLSEYLELVIEKFSRRSLIRLGYQAINASYLANIPVKNILDNLEEKIFLLGNQNQSRKTYSNVELFKNIFSELKKQFLVPSLPGLASGYFDLDKLTQGFQKSDLIVLAARPSVGKTALSLNIAANVIKNTKLPVLFFSLEMSTNQILYRMLSVETNIEQQRLKNGKLSEYDWIKINKAIKIISKLPFFIEDTPNLSTKVFQKKVENLMQKQNQTGLVIIDYLQLMQTYNEKNKNRVQELSDITRVLKTTARKFNIPIIALSQLSRNIETRLDQKPILSDLRDSGSIEQDADLVLMLHQPKSLNFEKQSEIDWQLTELLVAKHRNGPLGTVKLKFIRKQTKFCDFY